MAGWRCPDAFRKPTRRAKPETRAGLCDLLSKPYIIARYFADQQAALDVEQAELEGIASQIAKL
jgi:type I restriction enzyme M protein